MAFRPSLPHIQQLIPTLHSYACFPPCLPPRHPHSRTHSGRISVDDLLALLELCRSRAREYQCFELEAQLQGYCTLQMWRAMSGHEGQQQFSNW